MSQSSGVVPTSWDPLNLNLRLLVANGAMGPEIQRQYLISTTCVFGERDVRDVVGMGLGRWVYLYYRRLGAA